MPTITIDLNLRRASKLEYLRNKFSTRTASTQVSREIDRLLKTHRANISIALEDNRLFAITPKGKIDISPSARYCQILERTGFIGISDIPKYHDEFRLSQIFYALTSKSPTTFGRIAKDKYYELHFDGSALNPFNRPENRSGIRLTNFLVNATNIGMAAAAIYYFGLGQYKYGAYFGPYFNSNDPALYFIFDNIPQSRWILPKIAASSILMGIKFSQNTSDHPRHNFWESLAYSWKFLAINAAADIAILSATNDWTPDELKGILFLSFVGSLSISSSIGWQMSKLLNKIRSVI